MPELMLVRRAFDTNDEETHNENGVQSEFTRRIGYEYRNGCRIIGAVESGTRGDDGLADFIGVRPRLFGIAYRMLGSAVEAEDVVREAFDYPYREIADILQLTEANTRQLVTRARKHIADGRKASVSTAEQSRFLNAFISAARNGDLPGLEALFASDVVSMSDGGGFVRAARNPVVGRDRVAKFIAAVTWFWTGVKVDEVEANGQPCMLISRAGTAVVLVVEHTSEDGINQIWWLMRPSKLGAITPALSKLHPPSST